MRRFLQAISWLVAIQAILIGLFTVALLSGTFVSPGYPTIVRIAVILLGGVLPGILSLISLHDPRTAARFGLPLAVLACIPLFVAITLSYGSLVGGFGRWEVPLALSLFILIIPAIFWKIAASFSWPLPLKRPLRSSLAHHPFSWNFTLFAVLLMVAISSLSMPWNAPIGDCGGRSLLDERGVPRGVDFTAKIIFVGPKAPYGILRGRSLWSFARVQERFGQRSLGVPRFVILRAAFEAADQSREYFVESTGGSNTVLGHLLPVAEPLECGRTATLQDAGAWIRVLREGAPRSGSRLIGRVYIGAPYDHRGRKPVPGAYVSLEGENGTIVSVADADGIYDFTGLQSGTYTLRAAVTISDGRVFSGVQPIHLKEAEVRDWDINAR